MAKYGIYAHRVQKLEAEKAKVELEGQVAEIELRNEAAERQHDAIMQDIEDEESLRPITRAINKTDKALKALKALKKVKENAEELKELGIDTDTVVNEQTKLIQECFK